MSESISAPGWPGIPGRWTSANKSGVGTAFKGSPVWFTISHGILNEVYSPRIDEAAIRDLGFIVTADDGFFSEEKRHAAHSSSLLYTGVPAYHLESVCDRGYYRFEKDIITDPDRPVVLIRGKFTPLKPGNYRLYVIMGSHIGNYGAGNTAWVSDYKGITGLFASRHNTSLCLMNNTCFKACSVGFVGFSDGWQDLIRNGYLASLYTRAENGNVALTGEIDLKNDTFVLALGFGRNPSEAAQQSRASLNEGFQNLLDSYSGAWRQFWQRQKPVFYAEKHKLFSISAMVILAHSSKYVPGAILASLAVPWGFSKGDGDLGGYHLIWPRDMVQSAGGLIAAGIKTEVRNLLVYLESTQELDGHWPQNMWIDGFPYWSGIQMDETALPILLFDLARRETALFESDIGRFWPMIKKALSYIAKNGPVTQQDRWEENGGYTPFTLAAEISALITGAELAELAGEEGAAPYLRETADAWYSCIDRWLYVKGGELADKTGVKGYYVRVTPPDFEEGDDIICIKNRPPASCYPHIASVVCTDALALVRFGLRNADDERILSTLKVIDTLLKVETPSGPCWHRYNGDGYGEHDDGRPFDGTGRGRLWPLLTGERTHYAIAAGNFKEAERLLKTMEGLADGIGLLPEQVWDSPDIPGRGLFFGRPTGSAMPLVWAHAEYLKLVRSLTEERVFDMPPQTVFRYLKNGVTSSLMQWRFNHKLHKMPQGKTLRIETLSPAMVHWSDDGWHTVKDTQTKDSGFGVYYADLPSSNIPEDGEIAFTFYWINANRWEGSDFNVQIKT
ncbi:MAG: glucan 1,4-alpha-glucosidase [Candidatus Acidulodesulfobacterium ferriphilum]|jgi:glucoamylase|uniref:Glucan 1,4-alpha-glucosidase n=1 Tax=Candidatus Acidulodesulfobacterium ferriphilum TaxID=2597223 RepID=A0A519BD42_9DELT|nr:MAG: glucan 1,4-alpha-glucosidase [Candidatus Acidulodesulfobacterium ferriphilum]